MNSNEDLQVDALGEDLKGFSIALGVSGGIASIVTPIIAREFRRYGANVKSYMTENSQKFITKIPLEWGTGNDVVTNLSGRSEHISLEDVVLVAPATMNTVNKLCLGIADNVVTTLVGSALGMGKKVYLAPTMHESLFNNPIFQENLKKVEGYGLRIIPPRIGEGKIKIPKINNIVQFIIDDIKNYNLLTNTPKNWIEKTDIRKYAERQAKSCTYLYSIFNRITKSAEDDSGLRVLFSYLEGIHRRQYKDLLELTCITNPDERESYYFESLYSKFGMHPERIDFLDDASLMTVLCIQAVSYLRGNDRYNLLQESDFDDNKMFISTWKKFYGDSLGNVKKVINFLHSRFEPINVYRKMQEVILNEDKIIKDIWRYKNVTA